MIIVLFQHDSPVSFDFQLTDPFRATSADPLAHANFEDKTPVHILSPHVAPSILQRSHCLLLKIRERCYIDAVVPVIFKREESYTPT
jgi:hypothetical protein